MPIQRHIHTPKTESRLWFSRRKAFLGAWDSFTAKWAALWVTEFPITATVSAQPGDSLPMVLPTKFL